jgi:hypothetical protein
VLAKVDVFLRQKIFASHRAASDIRLTADLSEKVLVASETVVK